MTVSFRKIRWWLQRRRKEDELREELQFHLDEESRRARRPTGCRTDEARCGRAPRPRKLDPRARRGARGVDVDRCSSSWRRTSATACAAWSKNRVFTALAALSLALGIGANTAIYSFMDAILLRSLPVADPASLVVVKWRSRPIALQAAGASSSCTPSSGSTYDDARGRHRGIFPFPAFERLQRHRRRSSRACSRINRPAA